MATISARQLIPDVNCQNLTPFIKKLLNNICDFYDEQDLIDVTFKLSSPTAIIPAHRLILSAASSYFKDLFKSDKGLTPVIELNNIDSDTFELLIAFCYTGKTLITIVNVDVMLKAAMYLKLDDAVVSCIDYILQHITEYTLQRAHCLERETHCVPLYEKLLQYEINNFMENGKVLKVHFAYNVVNKTMHGVFAEIGIALYTICFQSLPLVLSPKIQMAQGKEYLIIFTFARNGERDFIIIK